MHHMHILTVLLVAAGQVSGVIAVVVYGLSDSVTITCTAAQGMLASYAHPDGPVGCCRSSEWGDGSGGVRPVR